MNVIDGSGGFIVPDFKLVNTPGQSEINWAWIAALTSCRIAMTIASRK